MKVRHSILIITYNQEELIGPCLDSVLTQSEMPYEVVVCDDHSPDNTWQVVQRYAEQYPQIIKAHRNDPNLGIFANVNKIKELATGDFVNFVSGDDLLPPGALEAYSHFIETKNMDCNEPFVIFSDCLILSGGGHQELITNRRNMARYDVFESIALGCLWGWDTGLSRGLLQAMDPLNTQIGYQADLLWHLDKAEKAKNHYYVPVPGYIYRANVGVTAATRLQQHLESKKEVHQLIRQRYGSKITRKIDAYLKFDLAWNVYRLAPTSRNYGRFFWRYVLAGRFRYHNQYRNNWKILVPEGAKRFVKKHLKK